MRFKVFFILFYLFPQLISAQEQIKVRLFTGYELKSLVITPITGTYYLVCNNDTVKQINKLEIVNIYTNEDSLISKQWLTYLCSSDTMELIPVSKFSYLRIKSIDPDIKVRYYDGTFYLWIDSISHNIIVVNKTNLETYIAGVVESEIGSNSNLPLEYLKAQAVISRTYAIKNIGAYAELGYDLCDNVNCQAYYGKSIKNRKVIKAVNATKGLVIVDSSLNVINSFFHSNSGGETAPSYLVWNDTLDYLAAVTDSFCLTGRNYRWNFKIKKTIWLDYLKQKGIILPAEYNFSMKMPHRIKYWEFKNGLAVKVTDIRKDWGLKSAFFDVYDDGTTLSFFGRGFGHGVGLSQEGALNMAKKGFNFREILSFYYNNIRIVPYHDVMKRVNSKE